MSNEQEQAEQVVDAEIEQTDDCLVKDRDEREAITTELPCETKELLRRTADQTGQYQWELLTEAIHEVHGGSQLTTIPQIEREIEIVENQRRNVREVIQAKEEECKRLEQRIEDLERRKAKLQDQRETKTQALDRTLEELREQGTHAIVGVVPIRELAAEWFGGDQERAIDALQDRNAEIDEPLPDAQFFEPETNGGLFS